MKLHHHSKVQALLLQLLIPLLSTQACPPGEYALDPSECWPCEPGFRCDNGTKAACEGGTWSARGAWRCEECESMCGAGLLRVRACDTAGDLVCAACPPGFGCDGGAVASVCRAGTYSVAGVCIPCGANHSSNAGASECVCLGEACSGCPPNTVAVGTQCRPVPKGYGLMGGELQRCAGGTYSSPSSSHCLACSANAWSSPGASSAEECICSDGYTRRGGKCVPCKAGTVFSNGECVLCAAGEYCLGKTHHEPCPGDMYSHRGAGMCSPCRMNSGCLRHCDSALNCTCDEGYVDSLGECRRCPLGTMESDGECAVCPPGYECKGGADVWACPLTTWSPGNVSACLSCDRCSEITSSRCNSTHNSVCERTVVPLGVVSVFQQYTIENVDGDMFGTFALLYAASIPKAQLLRVCDKDRCIQCFQGLCPDSARMRRLCGPGFELALEVRTFASRIDDRLESLNRPAFLSELAKTTMRKLAPNTEFLFFSRVEHSTICPQGLVWDKVACKERRSSTKDKQRSYLGLAVSVLILIMLALLGWNGRQCAEWIRDCCCGSRTAEEEQLVDQEEEEENEKIMDNFPAQWRQ